MKQSRSSQQTTKAEALTVMRWAEKEFCPTLSLRFAKKWKPSKVEVLPAIWTAMLVETAYILQSLR